MTVRSHEITDLDDDLAARLVDLWDAVNVDGGSVGYPQGSHRVEVTEDVTGYVAKVATGGRVGVALRDEDALVGVGFIDPGAPPLTGHTGHVLTVMTDPTRRGEGLGRRLMAEIDRAAAGRGLEVLTLGYRDGTGLGDFYAACGWTETGRVPGYLRLAPDDTRTLVQMARQVVAPGH